MLQAEDDIRGRLVTGVQTCALPISEIAASLGEQKAKAVIESGAAVVASGNIGCLTQMKMHLEKLEVPVQVRHTVQVLRDAWTGRAPH